MSPLANEHTVKTRANNITITESKAIAESDHFLMLERYDREWMVAEGYQSEGHLQRQRHSLLRQHNAAQQE